jgi:cell division protein ZapB
MQRDSLITLAQSKDNALEDLSTEKKALAEKVAIASVLKAEDIKVSVVNTKGKAMTSKVYKVKVVDKIKVDFCLGDNKVAKKNNKDIYLRLIEPSGSTLFEGEKIFTVEGKESFYTDKQTLQFDNTRQHVVFLYSKGSPYKPGKYAIELFAEGHKIGESQLVMK